MKRMGGRYLKFVVDEIMSGFYLLTGPGFRRNCLCMGLSNDAHDVQADWGTQELYCLR